MRIFSVLVAVGFGLAVAGVVGPIGPAAAQAGNSTGPAPINATDQGNESGQEVVAHDFERSVDQDLTVKSWRYNFEKQQFVIDLRVHNRTQVSITEALSLEQQGDAEISVFSQHLRPGDHRINFSARPGASDEAAAVISTPRSFSQGRAVILSTGYIPDELPMAQTASTTGWMGGFGVLLTMTVLAGIQKVRSARKEPEELK